ncbi:MAG: protein kinase [Pseudomonadota bacterium]
MSKETLPNFISGYKVVKKLGRGSFSNVYLVEDSCDSSIRFALKKIIKPQWSTYIDQEIKALKIMSDYNSAPKLYHVKKNKQEICLIMDYIPGTDIRRYIQNKGVFSEQQAFRFLSDLLTQLTYIHSHNILHMDIKMTNIMRFKHKFCLIDWGISRSGICVKTKNLIGGVRYLAPETYQGYQCQASEVYSLGCILYYCISGKYLFGLKKKDVLEKKIYASMYLTPTFDFPVTEKLKYIILRMLEKDPLKRATVEEIENIISGDWDVEEKIDLKEENIVPENIFDVYDKMAKDNKHNIYAQYRLALIFEKDDNKENNLEHAIYWYKKSAMAGYALAQHRLGFLFLYGKCGLEKNYKTAFYWFTKAANQKYKRSQYYLGKMYEFAKGVRQNKNKAIELYTLAIQNSDLKAEERLKRLQKETST